MRALMMVGALCAIAGCSESPQITESPPGVSYRVTNNDVTETNQRASRYCQQYGKSAAFNGLNQASGDTIAVYSCR